MGTKSRRRQGASSVTPFIEGPFPEVAAAMRPLIEQIIKNWMKRVRAAVPSASELSFVELRDNLPNILAAMADTLGSGASKQKVLRKESPEQGVYRFQQRYDVRDLMTEDRIMRKVIIEHAESGLKRRMTQAEQIGLDSAIDVMLQEAVIAFVNHQNAQLRTAAEVELKHLSFLSHDLNNNLGSITLWLQALRSQLSALPHFGEAVETLDTTQQAILNTMGGMGRLLQSERLRRQGANPALSRMDVNAVVRNLLRVSSELTEQKGLKIVAEIEPDAVIVTDGELILLVLQNMIGNAVKYSTRGTIHIRCRREGEGRWIISVSDQGPGIAPNQLERIFSAFRRGQTYGQGGMGLGLTIASQAAKLLGGELRIESRVGKGSTFSLMLPAGHENGDGDGDGRMRR